MGLSGRKVKQRIGHDPRNLSWADDANKFGTAYLQKLGWSAGTGLGSSGEGRTTHIKVDQKLDMLGIGAAHQKDPNGIAWKQNRDFENLLKRLNNTNESEEKEAETKVDGFVGAGKDLDAEVTKEAEEAKEVETGKSKKRKRTKDVKHVDDSGGGEKKKKKKKKDKVRDNEEVNDKEDEGAREGERDVSDSATEPTLVASVEPSSTSTPQPARTPIIRHPHRAHRARFIASKRLALHSSTAMDEILGISRSGTSTPYPPTSVPDTPSELSADLGLQELTTSSKSVMDYFKEKLQAKSDAKTALVSTSSSPRTVEIDDRPEEDARTTGGLGFHAGIGSSSRHAPQSDENDTPRFGLGSFSRAMAMSSTPVFSKSTPELPVPLQSTENDDGRTLVGEEEESNVEPQKKEKKSKTSKIVEQTEPETAAPKAEKKRKDKKARRKAKEDERSEQSPRRTPVDDVAIGEADPDRDPKSRSEDSLVHVENVVGEVGGECDSNSKRSKKKRKKHRDSETCLE